MGTRRAFAAGTSLLAACGLAGPTPAGAAGPGMAVASAGSLQTVAGTLVYTAYDGFANVVNADPGEPGEIEIDDSAGPIDLLGPECVPSPAVGQPHKVTCDRTGVTGLRLDGGDFADVLASVRDPMSAQLLGGTGDDQLRGGPGDDHLDGGPGADVLTGGLGDDLLIGGPGADQLDGGIGTDTVSYAAYSLGVTADADGATGDDGGIGEGDSIGADVEKLTGGAGPDELGGNSLANTLQGNAGADHLSGGAGIDTLLGGAGYDNLDGGTGPASGIEKDLCVPGADGASLQRCEVVRR